MKLHLKSNHKYVPMAKSGIYACGQLYQTKVAGFGKIGLGETGKLINL